MSKVAFVICMLLGHTGNKIVCRFSGHAWKRKQWFHAATNECQRCGKVEIA